MAALSDPGGQGGVLSRQDLALLAGCAVICATLYFISEANYLLFHTLVELFSVAVATGIFMIGWNARPILTNDYLAFLGIAYLFVGLTDLLHALSYPGVGVLKTASTNVAAQLWIAARYMESGSLLAATFFFNRRMEYRWVLLFYVTVFGAVLASVFWIADFPTCFVEGRGLTLFKKASEYAISGLLLGAIYMLWRHKDRFNPRVFLLLAGSIGITVASELSFTLYRSAYGFPNFLGHVFKLISFALIYQAIIRTGLLDPYALLLKDLRDEHSKLEELSQKDPLTGTFNRRYMREFLQTEKERAMRYGHPIAFVMVDVDRFKEINDRFGHLMGDAVLKSVADYLKDNVRAMDRVIRYGGDEFLIIMPETAEEAAAIKSRLCIPLPSVRDETGRILNMPVTLSVGTSHWRPSDTRSLEQVIAEADRNMYENKKRKNQ